MLQKALQSARVILKNVNGDKKCPRVDDPTVISLAVKHPAVSVNTSLLPHASFTSPPVDSMQCSYDCRGNSVPMILLLMQSSLYEQGGLRAEGIFKINAENSQEYLRDQLNSGVVPNGIDVHCRAGLIKAWFRELPNAVLDPLSPAQVMQCQSEEDCTPGKRFATYRGFPAQLAINLMSDVVQEENENKMNARNVATVFAPNMTQLSDI